MSRFKILIAILAVAAVGLTGCIVSGTFTVVEDVAFSFTADTGYYWYPIDLTENEDWDDHREELDDIEALGFDFNIQNTSGTDCEFNIYAKMQTGPIDFFNPPVNPDLNDWTLIFGPLNVPANTTMHVTYGESLSMIQNMNALQTIIMNDRFDFIGTSCGGTGDDRFIVTEGQVIVTVAASDS